MVNRYSRLLHGNIIGIIDNLDALRSEFTGEKVGFHSEYFGEVRATLHWRWNHDRSIWWTVPSDKPNAEQYEAIQNHLTKKYGLKWYANGHHDIKDLMKKAKKEK